MDAVSNSLFLQALGWATLNSFWQMAMLWVIFQTLQHFFSLSSNRKYQLAASSVFTGFAWFAYTFISYYFFEAGKNALVSMNLLDSLEVLPMVLSSASIAYLGMIIFPTYKIIRNWRFVRTIKKYGLEKTAIRHRLFVQKIAAQLGIKKPVKVYISQLVTSPLTVGFFKPIILLPVAALNNLSLAQVEAVLLHELSHIRRHDYLVNLLLTLINVVLYFNPFVRLFIRRVEMERENCCDEMVLQFEYDKFGYASALLELEKSSQLHLAMAAANKHTLLHRIQRIVGVQRKPVFSTGHFAGAFAGLLMLLVINSLIITKNQKLPAVMIHDLSQPFSFFVGDEKEKKSESPVLKNTFNKENNIILASADKVSESNLTLPENPALPPAEELTPDPGFVHASFNMAETNLAAAETEQVSKTIETTRKVLETKWAEVEKSIGDGMTKAEKAIAKQEYLREVEKVDWQKMELELKSSYEKIDWNKVNTELSQAMADAKLDSLQSCYSQVLSEINKAKHATCGSDVIAMPDASLQQLQKATIEVQKQLERINNLRERKVIRL